MLKQLALIIGMILLCGYAYGRTYAQFQGIVVDDNNDPLAGASVIIQSLDKIDVTDDKGKFLFRDLTIDTFEVQITFLGYETITESVSLTESKEYSYSLKTSSIELDESIILDQNTKHKKETPLNSEIVNDEYLKENLGGSLMKSLERLAGVTTIDIGSGQSKPVIRGLGFNRVVVVENNIKHEAQQWGADHGLEIDQYAIDNVEIIKGPASLMYGSDAIGGVINLKKSGVPAKNSFGGKVDLSAKTNNDFIGTSVSLYTRKEQFFITARATFLEYGDFKVPTNNVDVYNYKVSLHDNQLRNTAGQEQNLHTSFGIIKDKFQSKFYISNVKSQGGFFANAHGLRPVSVDFDFHDASSRDIQYPRQNANHFKVVNKSTYWSKKWRAEIDLGYQSNLREEWSLYVDHGYMPSIFPETLEFNPEIERQFDKKTISGSAKLTYDFSEKTQFNTGISSEHQGNEISGRGFIIPAYQQFNVGGFAVAKHKLSEKNIIQAGVRYDYGIIEIDSYYDWFASPLDESGETLINLQRSPDITRNFSNFSWSAGYNYNPGKWSYKVNIGKSFRMPIAKELGANGVNYHRFSYEVGNANLSPEISFQFDTGVELSLEKFSFKASPFLNYFSNYIYLNPTAEHDRLYGLGNQIFEYTESEVLRCGGEIYAHYDLFKFLELGLIGEYVYSEQLSGEKKGFTLPFAPPASGIINLKYHSPQLAFIDNPYVSLDYRLTGAQKNIVPPEVITDGYQTISLSLGGDIAFRKERMDISIQVQNLLNAKYFNHTSYYRLLNVPEAGRNLVVNISIPLSGRKDK